MNWPALSPDLNPIEHLWDEIQRRLNEEQSSLTTAAELSISFQRVWAGIPIAFLNRLVNYILLQEVSCCPGCMRTRIILLERLVLMTCEMQHTMRSQNFIDVTGSCYSIASPRADIIS
jgi:hypothetical protein